jgi:hypothetical protein
MMRLGEIAREATKALLLTPVQARIVFRVVVQENFSERWVELLEIMREILPILEFDLELLLLALLG